MPVYLSVWDYAIIALYVIAIAAIGYLLKKRSGKIEEYFLAGRRLTLPIFVATLVSTWYGGTLGVVELSFNSGIVNWVTQGGFWYISYLFFALFLAKKIRESNLYTVPDQIAKFYGKKAGILGAILNYLMLSPAPYFLSLGIIFSVIFPIPVWAGILLGSAMVLYYIWRGGFLGDVYTDVLQFILMFIGVGLVIPFAFFKFGGISFLASHLPATHFIWRGDWATQSILVWGFIACWTLVDPSFYQRCYATKDSSIPKKGILISIAFWILFDFFTTAIGLYARAAMPEINAATSLPVFASAVLPNFIRGIFFAGLLASVMSTVDSFVLLSGMTISHDIYAKAIKPGAGEEQILKATKWGMAATTAISLIVALFFRSVIGMFYTIGTIGISGLLIPLLIGFFYKKEKKPMAGFFAMLAGSIIAVVWMMFGYINGESGYAVYWLGIEPLYPGILSSFIAYCIASRMQSPRKCSS